MNHGCNMGKLHPERLSTPVHLLMPAFTEEGKKCELWLQHQIIISMYRKISLRVTVNALWTRHAADTKNLKWPTALFKLPWNIFRGAVSSKVLTVCFTSQQIFADIFWHLVSSLRTYSWPDLSLLFPVALYVLRSLLQAPGGYPLRYDLIFCTFVNVFGSWDNLDYKIMKFEIQSPNLRRLQSPCEAGSSKIRMRRTFRKASTSRHLFILRCSH